MKFKNFFAVVILFSCQSSLLAAECKYKREYINADIDCNGKGDCMLKRFQAYTAYEGDYGDYMDCWAWSAKKMMGN